MRVPFLLVGQAAEDGGDAHQKGDAVLRHVVQGRLRIEFGKDDDRGAGIESRAGACAVEAAAVEPGRRVHRHVPVAHREMDHHVVGRQHLVDTGHRDGLGMTGRAGGVQAAGFVIDIVLDLRLFAGSAFHEAAVGEESAFGSFFRREDQVGPMRGQFQRLFHGFAIGSIEKERLGAGIVDAPGEFARREAEAGRAAYGARLVRGEIAEDEFGAVAQLHHDDVPLPEAGREEGLREAVALGIQLPVGPAASVGGIHHRQAVSVAPHVP